MDSDDTSEGNELNLYIYIFPTGLMADTLPLQWWTL